jgi:hypothetical protein
MTDPQTKATRQDGRMESGASRQTEAYKKRSTADKLPLPEGEQGESTEFNSQTIGQGDFSPGKRHAKNFHAPTLEREKLAGLFPSYSSST